MVATLVRPGTFRHQVQTLRALGAWESLRVDAESGNLENRCYMNLGHKLDDTSGSTWTPVKYLEGSSHRLENEESTRPALSWFPNSALISTQDVDSTGIRFLPKIIKLSKRLSLFNSTTMGKFETGWENSSHSTKENCPRRLNGHSPRDIQKFHDMRINQLSNRSYVIVQESIIIKIMLHSASNIPTVC